MLEIFLLLIFLMIMFFCGFYSFCLNYNHLLLILLSLEFVMMSLYFLLILYLMWFSLEFYLGLFFLVMTVCEGALGLSLLVNLIRSFGSDYCKSFMMLW
uniref:NADH-ubiquinone oxidoreductase chain 4L n=1 Tax=Arge similis TaxID=621222 RepID=A0A3S5HLN2_9HYME|nr:NADH dehydrogenase subunit 4L [Arge similis]